MTNTANRTFLVLGSAGQIGAHLCHFLRQRGCSCIEFDIVSDPACDLRVRSGRLQQAMQQCDFVMFLAFDVGGARYLKTYQHTYEFLSNNTKILDCVFQELSAARKPFIFASSQMSNMSHSSYGLLKALGECYTRSLGGRIVKFWNVYGVEHDPQKSHAITDFIVKARAHGRIEMLTNGTERRQFLYADDCSEALLSLARPELYSELTPNTPLHVTSFEWTSIREVADLIGDMLKVPVVPGQAGDELQKSQANEPDPFILKFWSPRTRLRDGIASVFRAMAAS